jgi:uncharacterized protein (DUF1697 family)
MRHIGLLRAVNVGGKRSVSMAELRAMLEKIGMKDAKTVLQSGNVVFDGGKKKPADLERLLEAEAEKRFGLVTELFVRTADEWDDVIAKNPFPKEAESDPGRLVVQFLKSAPSAAQVRALEAAIVGREVVRADGRHLYAFYPDGQGQSKLTNAVLARHLASPCTGRNWNTVLRLAKS